MPIRVYDKLNKEKEVLKKFYDKAMGNYFIPMIEINDIVLDSMLKLLSNGYIITALWDCDGSSNSEKMPNEDNSAYIIYNEKDIVNLRVISESENIGIIKSVINKTRAKLLYKENIGFFVTYDEYSKNTNLQKTIDEILWRGVFNPNTRNGYSICLCIRDNKVVLLEAKDVGC